MGARSTREYTRAVGEWVVIEQGVGGLYTRVVGGWVVIWQGVDGLYTRVVGGWVVIGQGWVVIGQGVSCSLFSSLKVISGHEVDP